MKNYICNLYLSDQGLEASTFENGFAGLCNLYGEIIVEKTINPYIVREVITKKEIPLIHTKSSALESIDDEKRKFKPKNALLRAFVLSKDLVELADAKNKSAMIEYINKHSDFAEWQQELDSIDVAEGIDKPNKLSRNKKNI